MLRRVARVILYGSTTVATALALASCGGEPVPTAQMRSAADAIARAQNDGAEQLAPQQLHTAQTKLANAHSQVASDHNSDARRSAEQADADADYADALSNAQRLSHTAGQLEQLQQRMQ